VVAVAPRPAAAETAARSTPAEPGEKVREIDVFELKITLFELLLPARRWPEVLPG